MIQWAIEKVISKLIVSVLTLLVGKVPMKTSNVDIIKRSEDLRLHAYLPTAKDVWTIGYGHTKGVKQGDLITEAEAETFLRQDLAEAEAVVNKWVKVGLNQNQFDALVSLAFNIGEGHFATSSVLRFLNSGDYQGAADHFGMWVKQKGKTLNGLVKRRKEEKDLFLS